VEYMPCAAPLIRYRNNKEIADMQRIALTFLILAVVTNQYARRRTSASRQLDASPAHDASWVTGWFLAHGLRIPPHSPKSSPTHQDKSDRRERVHSRHSTLRIRPPSLFPEGQMEKCDGCRCITVPRMGSGNSTFGSARLLVDNEFFADRRLSYPEDTSLRSHSRS